MNDFYKKATETLEILVKALNGNTGYRREWRHNAPVRYKNAAALKQNKQFSTRRKILPCNR